MLRNKYVKYLALICTLASLFITNVHGAGYDDGRVFATKKNGVSYLGVQKSEWCVEFYSADGSKEKFRRYDGVDFTNDSKTDILDLVRLAKNPVDMNFDKIDNSEDITILRKILLGKNDFVF